MYAQLVYFIYFHFGWDLKNKKKFKLKTLGPVTLTDILRSQNREPNICDRKCNQNNNNPPKPKQNTYPQNKQTNK